jgi:hypothetical protein
MSRWDALLDQLASGPRENGTQELEATGGWLAAELRARGLQTELFPFTAYPHEVHLLGIAVLLLCIAYFVLLRGRRFGPALTAALVVPALAVAVVDLGLPALGGLRRTTQHDVIARLPAADAERRIVLSAHYDTKTEPLDHVARAPIQFLTLPVLVVMVAAPLLRRPRLQAFAGWVAIVWGAAIALVHAGGALMPSRSHGAVDDGAACAVLLEAGAELAKAPPSRTEVVIALFSAEELGAHGAQAWVDSRFAGGVDLPTACVNFELVGSSTTFQVGGESSLTRHHRPSAALLDLLDQASVAAGGEPLARQPVGGLTDAVAFLARGIPAATVVGREGPLFLPLGMHGPRDRRERIDLGPLELTRRFAEEIVRAYDRSASPISL